MRKNMEIIKVLLEASKRVYDNVKHMPGTKESGGDFGRGAGGDISRRIDIVAEKTILDYLKEINFDCVVLGEECGKVELSKNPKGFIIMDAVDGSTNAVRGLPFFCCSLAFATNNRLSSVTDGVVIDLSRGDRYYATKGKGAFLNGKRISVNNDKNPIYFVVGLDISGISPKVLGRLSPIIASSNHIRHFGANALEFGMFSKGLIDVFIDLRDKIRVTDIAAGLLIALEAGGLVVDKNGKPLDSDLGYDNKLSFIAASNKKALDDIMDKLNHI